MYKRKGVTPVVATTMLVLIAIGASFTAYNFIQGTIDGFQERAEDEISEGDLQRNSDIAVDSAYENNGNIEFVLRNTGQYTVEHSAGNWEVFINGRLRTGDVDFDSSDVDGGLDPRETATVETSVNFPSSEDKIFEIEGDYVDTSFVCLPGPPRC